MCSSESASLGQCIAVVPVEGCHVNSWRPVLGWCWPRWRQVGTHPAHPGS